MIKSDCYEKRIERLKVKNNSVIVIKDENIYYFSGFYAKDSNSLLLILEKKVILLVNFLYFEEAKRILKNKKIEILQIKKDRFCEVCEILKDFKIKKIALEFEEISHNAFLNLSKKLIKQKIYIYDISRDIGHLRLIKDAFELEKITKAAKIADHVYEDLKKKSLIFFEKKSEIMLSLEIEKNIIKSGGEKKSFDFVVAYNRNTSKPHYFPENTYIDEGLVLIDFGAKFKNYCSDITRTFF
jgi:Xaa-Pro aminopeptidase